MSRSPAPRLVVVALAALLLALGGCGEDPGGPDVADGGSILDDLAGRTFVADRVDSPDHTVVPGSTIRLKFTADTIGAHAGCNSMGGDVSVEDGVLVVGPISMTEMACDEPLMRQDTWLSGLLGDRPAVDLEGDRLTLRTDDTVLVLTEEVERTAPLEGTVWQLDSVISGGSDDGAVSSLPQGAGGGRSGLSIEDGTLTVHTGCNRGSAPVEIGESDLTVGPLRLTKMACPGARGELERTFLEVLEPPTAYAVEGDRLTLTSADGSQGLGFVAAAVD